MGNSLLGNGHMQLASDATIDFKKTERNESGIPKEETWTVSYIIDGSTVGLTMGRFLGKDGDAELLRFRFYDKIGKGGSTKSITFFINENDLVEEIDFTDLGRFCDMKFVNETYNRWGGITKTNAFFHGFGSKGRGLLVVEEKRKNGYRMPCTVTVSHYYAVTSENKKIDIGLSMVAHVRLSNKNNGELVVSADGPIQHPSSTLLHLFQHVDRTRTWKPTSCPHYAEAQRRRRQFESESENEDRNNLQPARVHGPVQSPRGGVFPSNEDNMGNDNGGNISAPREINVNSYERRQQQRMFWQSQTESGREDGNNHRPARFHWPWQNGGSIHANDGSATRGNYNSNFLGNGPFLSGRYN